MDEIWNTFNGLFKTAHAQGLRIEELETRLCELERQMRDLLAEREAESSRHLHLVEPEESGRVS